MPSSSPTLGAGKLGRASQGSSRARPAGCGRAPSLHSPRLGCSWIQVRAHGGCAVHHMQGAQGATAARAAARLLGHADDTARQEVSRTVHVPAQRSHPTRPHAGSPGSGSAHPILAHWLHELFALSNHSPPLARENRSRQNPSGGKGNPHPAVYP